MYEACTTRLHQVDNPRATGSREAVKYPCESIGQTPERIDISESWMRIFASCGAHISRGAVRRVSPIISRRLNLRGHIPSICPIRYVRHLHFGKLQLTLTWVSDCNLFGARERRRSPCSDCLRNQSVISALSDWYRFRKPPWSRRCIDDNIALVISYWYTKYLSSWGKFRIINLPLIAIFFKYIYNIL